MESNHLTTRTYTTPTCTLIVANPEQPPSVSIAGQTGTNNRVDFILHLEDPDRSEADAITLQGQPQQLDHLQQVVSKYVAELVAKFPLPTTNHNMTAAPDRSPQSDTVPQPRPDVESPRSGLVKNLPGLRTSPPSDPPAHNLDTPASVPAPSLVSKFFDLWNKQQPQQHSRSNDILDRFAPTAVSQNEPTVPYLTGVGERALDHQLHLGPLTTVVSGEALTLSAIQLFDLATVLDEYAAETINRQQPQPSILNRNNIPGRNNPTTDVAATSIPLSRLPNLPKTPAPPALTQVYYRTRRSRSSLMSAIPWAVAAAIAVGVPLLLLDPKPNPVKDFTSKVKIPDVAGSKKSAPAKLPGDRSTTTSDPSTTAGVPTATSPTPWQAQPVQPPSVNKPLNSGVSTAQNPNKIGVAPLPEAIVGRSGNLPTTDLSGSGASTAIAPNPLSSEQLPSDLTKIDSNTRVVTTKPTPKVSAKSGRNTPATKVTPTTKIGQLPIEEANPAGKISVSSQPMLTPPADLAPAISPNPQTPLNPGQPSMSGGIDPVDPKPQILKKTAKPKVKPTTAATSNSPAKPSVSTSQQPAFEPFTPVPKNPNLIDPAQNSPQSEPQNPPIVPNQPLPPNNETSAAEPANNPSLQETKRYFQSKWKADNNQSNSLQYVVQVSGKSGTVRSVEPQGEAATAYLQQSKFIKPGQKLVSPAAAGSKDQKIRVLLQPDGNVDTFMEP